MIRTKVFAAIVAAKWKARLFLIAIMTSHEKLLAILASSLFEDIHLRIWTE
jgi:hypothetical protein